MISKILLYDTKSLHYVKYSPQSYLILFFFHLEREATVETVTFLLSPALIILIFEKTLLTPLCI